MSIYNGEYMYVMGDADKIREKIEYYLLNHDLDALTTFSQNLTNAINQVKETAILTMNAQVIIAGGDDVLFSVPSNTYRKELIQQLQVVFCNATGVNMSFGVGKTVEAAYINLRKAKSSPDFKIVEEDWL